MGHDDRARSEVDERDDTGLPSLDSHPDGDSARPRESWDC
jgi:hypothetical protein